MDFSKQKKKSQKYEQQNDKKHNYQQPNLKKQNRTEQTTRTGTDSQKQRSHGGLPEGRGWRGSMGEKLQGKKRKKEKKKTNAINLTN